MGATSAARAEQPNMGGRGHRKGKKRNKARRSAGLDAVGCSTADHHVNVLVRVVDGKVRKTRLPKRKVGLTRIEEEKIKTKQRGNPGDYGVHGGLTFKEASGTAPSEPWVEAQFVSHGDIGPNGQEIVYRYHRGNVFPPRPPRQLAEATKMKMCAACGRFNPPQAVRPIGRYVEIRLLEVWCTFTPEALICDDCMCDCETDTRRQMREAGVLPDRGHQSVKREITR